MWKTFSEKQLRALCWWRPGSPVRGASALICDGAVRSGKTMCMGLSFFAWAAAKFQGQAFALCGKSAGSVKRNLLLPLLPMLREAGFRVRWRPSQNLLEAALGGRCNRFYLFGGRDESAAALIQGITLAGVLFDEVALMPRSFVEQALARCSVEGAVFWFNCNPESPSHWFYREWICKREERHALYLHFHMEDNPSLSPEVLQRYRSLYSGAFYERFVLGKWVAAEGLVYPFMAGDAFCEEPDGPAAQYAISCDYGTVNPASFGLWGLWDGVWYRVRESYYDSKRDGGPRTDEEHYAALEELAGEREISCVVVDPSAASFLETVRRHGRFPVRAAKNDVLDGVRATAEALRSGKIRVCRACRDCIREFSLYRWQPDAPREAPVKENDHAMDDMRYFVTTVLAEGGGGFFALAAPRKEGMK